MLFALLYFSEGAPVGFIWWYLPTMLRAEGVELHRITTLTAAVSWPWILKFLWAPLIDTVGRRRLGYRGCVIAAQLMMGLALLPLLSLRVDGTFGLALAILLLHAFAAASQDVAIDAWAISLTPHQERGKVTAFMQAGMLVGRWAFGAGLLIVASYIAPAWTIAALILGIWGAMSVVILGTRRDHPGPSALAGAALEEESPKRDSGRLFWGHIQAALNQRQTWIAVAFALTGGIALESVGAVVGPFLIDRGYTSANVGVVQTVNVALMLAGGFVGGIAADRLDRRYVAGAAVVLLAALVGLLAGVDLTASQATVLLPAAIVAVYFGIGVLTASSYAFLMDRTDPRLGATQFSAYMGMTNACESGSNFAIGRLIRAMGYPLAFLVAAGVSLVALVPLALDRLRKPAGAGIGDA